MRVEVVFQQPEPAELPPMFGQHLDPATGENEMGMGGSLGAGARLRRHRGAAMPTMPPQRDPTDPSTWGRVGRNEPCPCGSGRKFKHCHGQFVA